MGWRRRPREGPGLERGTEIYGSEQFSNGFGGGRSERANKKGRGLRSLPDSNDG